MKKLLVALMFAGLIISSSAVVFAQDDGTSAVEEVATPAATAATPVADTPVAVATAVGDTPTIGASINKLRGGEYVLGLAGLIFVIVAGVGRVWKPKSKTGKRIFAMVVAFSVSGIAVYWAGAPLSMDLLFTVGAAIWAASGINEDAKDAVRS